jgi:hypothetical protein
MDPAMSHDLILMKENGRICTLALNRPETRRLPSEVPNGF